MLNSKIPEGNLETKWNDYKGHVKLVNPSNKRKLEIVIIGTGLAGASAAAALGELGYKVKAFCFQDSPSDERTVSLHRAASMLQKIIRTTATVCSVFFMIPSKVATTVHGKQRSPPGRSKREYY